MASLWNILVSPPQFFEAFYSRQVLQLHVLTLLERMQAAESGVLATSRQLPALHSRVPVGKGSKLPGSV